MKRTILLLFAAINFAAYAQNTCSTETELIENGTLDNPEVVVNCANFSQFFSSNYACASATSNCNTPIGVGKFAITKNATQANCPWTSTGNTTNFLVFDSDVSLADAWKKSVNVIAGSQYTFSILVRDIATEDDVANPDHILTVDLYANTTKLISSSNLKTADGWKTVSVSYTATTTGSITLAAKIVSTGGYGDVGMDNFSFIKKGSGTIVNADFENATTNCSGTPSFTSSYTCIPVPTSCGSTTIGGGNYAITTNAGLVNCPWVSTGNTTKFMVLDFKQGTNLAWSNTVNVQSGITYTFSADMRNIARDDAENTISMSLIVNNATVANSGGVKVAQGWKTFSGEYTAKTSATITIEIMTISGTNYSDGGLDNIVFKCKDIATSVNDEQIVQSQVSVYPNPVTDRIQINAPSNNVFNVTICDMAGKEYVNKAGVKGGEAILMSSEMQKGIYLMKLSGEGADKIIKLVKAE